MFSVPVVEQYIEMNDPKHTQLKITFDVCYIFFVFISLYTNIQGHHVLGHVRVFIFSTHQLAMGNWAIDLTFLHMIWTLTDKWKITWNCSPFRSTWVHPRFLVGIHVTRSLCLCVCFVDCCLSFCHLSFGQYVVCFTILITPLVSSNSSYLTWPKLDVVRCYFWVSELSLFLPLLRRFNPAEPVVEKSVILYRIKISRTFPRMLSNR